MPTIMFTIAPLSTWRHTTRVAFCVPLASPSPKSRAACRDRSYPLEGFFYAFMAAEGPSMPGDVIGREVVLLPARRGDWLAAGSLKCASPM
jgi:hypothetical protein